VVATTDSSPKNSGKTHKVQTGETLFSISKKHGMSTEAIVAANPKVKASSLRPGQVVSLGGDAPATTMISAPARAKAEPGVETTSDAAPAPVKMSPPVLEATTASTTATPESEPAAAAKQDVLSPTAERKIRPVTIEGEMTYGEFATKHGTNAERLNALNGLDLTTATVLAKGSELYVPAQP
jgi:LysM repeat protein